MRQPRKAPTGCKAWETPGTSGAPAAQPRDSPRLCPESAHGRSTRGSRGLAAAGRGRPLSTLCLDGYVSISPLSSANCACPKGIQGAGQSSGGLVLRPRYRGSRPRLKPPQPGPMQQAPCIYYFGSGGTKDTRTGAGGMRQSPCPPPACSARGWRRGPLAPQIPCSNSLRCDAGLAARSSALGALASQ